MAVTDEAIGKIKAMILSGLLKRCDRLPKEPDLAAQLGLSRNSLREPVKALSLLNVLDGRQGDGTYVTSLEALHRGLLDALAAHDVETAKARVAVHVGGVVEWLHKAL